VKASIWTVSMLDVDPAMVPRVVWMPEPLLEKSPVWKEDVKVSVVKLVIVRAMVVKPVGT